MFSFSFGSTQTPPLELRFQGSPVEAVPLSFPILLPSEEHRSPGWISP